jgi:hypothetical protein
MGISNTIPPSRLIQPGVVANTAARPTSPFTGQAIYQVDTNQYLIWNGTAWVIPNTPAQNPTGLELVTTATCSSGGTASGGVVTVGSAATSVTVTNAFSSLYDNYRITITGGTSPAVNPIRFQLGASVANYYGSLPYGNYATTGVAAATMNNAAYWLYAGTTVQQGLSTTIEINCPFLAQVTSISAPYFDSANAGHLSGYHGVNASYTDFTVTPNASTWSGCIIRTYGYRKS